MLCVLIGGKHAGDIEFRKRRATLRYRPEYIGESSVPLSVRFPVAGREASGPELRNWLLNLLPEDDEVLNHLRFEYGVAGRDPLRLLETPMGADCAGAVQFCPPERLADLLASRGGEQPVSHVEISEWLRDYPVLPASMDRLRSDLHVGFSLAGMQPKIALRRAADGGWMRPWGRLPTTHIIKAARVEYPDECVFEHLAMETAARLGIPAARTEVSEFEGLQIIIVTRFDRIGEGTRRIHQEDTCQALGKPPSEKYERFNGPGIAELRELASNAGSSTASRNVDRLRDMLIYHWLIVSNDAHAKNYSWLFAQDGSHRLAPLYDACSWLPYRRNRQIQRIPLAMSMGEGFNLKTCDKEAGLVGLAHKLRRTPAEVCERAVDLANGLPAALDATMNTLPEIAVNPQTLERHVIELHERARQCESLATQVDARTVGDLRY